MTLLSFRARVVAEILLVSLAILSVTDSEATKPTPISLAYATDGSGASLTAQKQQLSYVSFDFFNVDKKGNVRGSSPKNWISEAKAAGVKVFPVFSNWGSGDFQPSIADAILRNAATKKKVIAKMVSIMNNDGYNGINIDFEGIPARDRSLFTSFIQSLKAAMGSSLLVISVPAKESDNKNDDWSGAFDFQALSSVADILQVMTYDEHGPWGGAGPVSGLDWFKRCLAYSIKVIPKSKISIGLPAYGYDFDLTNKGGDTVDYKDTNALLASTGATAKWDSASSSPYFNYQATDGSKHVVWYENSESIKLKVQAALAMNVTGISVWSLGEDNQNFWDAVYSA